MISAVKYSVSTRKQCQESYNVIGNIILHSILKENGASLLSQFWSLSMVFLPSLFLSFLLFHNGKKKKNARLKYLQCFQNSIKCIHKNNFNGTLILKILSSYLSLGSDFLMYFSSDTKQSNSEQVEFSCQMLTHNFSCARFCPQQCEQTSNRNAHE